MTPIQALEIVRELINAIGPSDKRSPLAEEILTAAEKGLVAPKTEAITLTLAQQHADELVTALRRARNCLDSQAYSLTLEAVDELLAKIDPQPPTLEEALDLLREIYSVGYAEQTAQAEQDSLNKIGALLARVPK